MYASTFSHGNINVAKLPRRETLEVVQISMLQFATGSKLQFLQHLSWQAGKLVIKGAHVCVVLVVVG